jgi:hypothetical protein
MICALCLTPLTPLSAFSHSGSQIQLYAERMVNGCEGGTPYVPPSQEPSPPPLAKSSFERCLLLKQSQWGNESR